MDRKQYKEEKRQKRRNFNRKYVYEYKLNKSCECCGNYFPPEVLDFHHKDPSVKENSIAVGSNSCWSTKKLQQEIEKCLILCSNCHRLVHSNLITLI